MNTVATPLMMPARTALIPGQAIRNAANVFLNYPLGPAPGRYTVQAAYDVPANGDTGWHGSVMSERMPLVVEERNTAEYREFLSVCDDQEGAPTI